VVVGLVGVVCWQTNLFFCFFFFLRGLLGVFVGFFFQCVARMEQVPREAKCPVVYEPDLFTNA